MMRALHFILMCLISVSVRSFAINSTTGRECVASMKSSDKSRDLEPIKVQTWNPLRLLVLKAGLTEPAWISPWNYRKARSGAFVCAYCGETIFHSSSKYDSGSGWPSFWRTYQNGAVTLIREWDGRVECSCGRCKSHLGHVFMDGPMRSSVNDQQLLSSIPESDPKGRNDSSRLPRFCINGAALKFVKANVVDE